MIVILKLFVIFSVTFANEEVKNDDVKNWKRFGESSWQNQLGNYYADPILAYITRLDSNLQPMAAPYLDYIWNTYTPIPAIAYFGDDAQEHLSRNTFSRRNADEKKITFHCENLVCPTKTNSCESTIEVISEDDIQIQINTQCLSITNEVLSNKTLISSNVSSGMFYFEIQTLDGENESTVSDTKSIVVPSESEKNMSNGNVLGIREEIILHCNFMTCPNQTHICKYTFKAVPVDFTDIEVTTQCLSRTNEVLVEQTTITKNPSSDRYYFEIEPYDRELFYDEKYPTEPIKNNILDEFDHKVLLQTSDSEEDFNDYSKQSSESVEEVFKSDDNNSSE